LGTRVTFRGGLVWAMGLFLVAAVVGSLALYGDTRTLVVDGLGIVAVWMSAGVCWLAVSRVGLRHPEVTLPAAAVTSLAIGLTYLAVVVVGGRPVPLVSPADVATLLFYPLMLAALVVAVRRHVRGLASSVWLDCAVGSLGAASVLAVLLSPVLDSALTGSPSMGIVLNVAYPMLDLLLVATIAGIAALQGVRMGSRWGLLAVGLLVFAGADIVSALQRIADTYVAGTPLDAGWGVGIALMAMWVDGVARTDRPSSPETRPATGAAALAVSVAATMAGLGVLVVSSRTDLSTLAVVLATVTLLAGTARTQGAFHRLAQLVQVGARLGENLRDGDLLARLGGDEFAVLLQDTGHDQAVDVAVKLRAALAVPFDLANIALHTSASVGIALFPDDGPDLSTLLRKADIAMYKAKSSGHGQHVYSSADDADDTARLQTVQELRTALTSDQLVVHYQPKIDLDTGEVHSVEALVRWDHPTRGLLYPDAFLDLIEEAGLMHAMTLVVLGIALDQAAVWHAQGQALSVAVNLSASSLVDADLPDEVASMLAARGVSPGALQLEITEEFLMADRDRARDILTRLRRHGIQISVDDFGAGYSSLSYLRDLPIDELKLDRSFILHMVDDPRAAALVASTIALAHSLDLRMVAEGVESDIAYTEITRLGCDQAQGYYMSRPVPAADLNDWLSTRRAIERLPYIPQRLP